MQAKKLHPTQITDKGLLGELAGVCQSKMMNRRSGWCECAGAGGNWRRRMEDCGSGGATGRNAKVEKQLISAERWCTLVGVEQEDKRVGQRANCKARNGVGQEVLSGTRCQGARNRAVWANEKSDRWQQ